MGMRIVLFVAIVVGLAACMPPQQQKDEQQKDGVARPATHMERCHGKGHHHNARQDHSGRCLLR